jgi:hypothetical protein
MQELHVVLNWFAELKRLVPTELPTFAQEPAKRPIGNEQSLAFIGGVSALEAGGAPRCRCRDTFDNET